MKKIWNKRSKEGVSPVIATILMVAITVVLAAVLYVMVMGMVDGPGEVTPAGSWLSVEATNSTSAKLIYGKLGGDCAPNDVQIFVEGPNGIYITLEISDGLEARVTEMSAEGAPTGVSARYTDLNWEGNNIGSGDFITIDGLSASGVYTVTQYYMGTDEIMIGGEDTFQI